MKGLRVVALLLALTSLGPGLQGCANWRASQLYGSGTRALDRGDVEQAVDDLERAAELAPQASEIQNHLGLAYGAAGRQAEARAAFQKAVDLDCDNRAAAENLAAAERGPWGARP